MPILSTKTSPLTVEHLTVHYDAPALWDLTFDIPSPLLVAIVGPNGAGKSTLIKGCLNLIPKTSGRISSFGKPLHQMNSQVAYVPQRESVDWDFPISVRELVLMGRFNKLKFLERPKKADLEAADALIEKVGLSPFRDRQIGMLSGGQQQRAFLARALIQDAPLTFMDEPFAGIDQATEVLLLDVLKELKNVGKTVIVVHHDLEMVKKHFDWAVLLNRCLISSGPPQEALSSQYLQRAYGHHFYLLEEALKLSKKVSRGEE